ncbi:MAG: hypothetical protein ACLFU2_14760, partial [Opitutales bacterium]
TCEGRHAIRAMLAACTPEVGPRGFRRDGEVERTEGGEAAWLTFETATAWCQGRVELRDGLGHVMFTMVEDLKGFEEAKGPRRPMGADHSARRGRRAALISGVAAFIAAVERFEQAVLADPLFAPTGPPAEAREGDLIVYPPLHDTAHERPVDRELLPDILSAFAPAKAGLGAGARLHRLEALKDEKGVTGQGASRVGVYFALPEAAAS